MGSISRRKIKRKDFTSKIWILAITIVMSLLFLSTGLHLVREQKETQKTIEALQKEKEQVEEKTEELEEEQKYRQTKKFIEEYAHNQLGLVYPGEIIFKTER